MDSLEAENKVFGRSLFFFLTKTTFYTNFGVRTGASIYGGVNPANLYCTDLNKVSLIFFLLTSVIYRYLLYVALFALTYISISSTRPTPLKAAVWSFLAEVRICMFYCLILWFSATVIFLFLFLLGILSDEWRVESNLKNWKLSLDRVLFRLLPVPNSWRPYHVFLNIKLTQIIIISCIIVALYVFHLNKSFLMPYMSCFQILLPFYALR